MPVLLGLDAEFGMENKLRKIVAPANSWVQGAGHVGADGAGTPWEIRPEPADTVAGLMDGVNECLSVLHSHPKLRRLRDCVWATASTVIPLGSHIHIDAHLHSVKVGVLDSLFTIPLALSCPSAEFIKRLQSYGQLGDARYDKPCTRGGSRTEWRSLWGFWGTPEQAKIVLEAVRIVVDQLVGENGGAGGRATGIPQAWQSVRTVFASRLGLDPMLLEEYAYINQDKKILTKYISFIKDVVFADMRDVPAISRYLGALGQDFEVSDLKKNWPIKEIKTAKVSCMSSSPAKYWGGAAPRNWAPWKVLESRSVLDSPISIDPLPRLPSLRVEAAEEAYEDEDEAQE